MEKIRNAPIRSNQTVSLDVVSLFTKVRYLLWYRINLLEEHTNIMIDDLMEMLTFCVETTDFGVGFDIYQQEERLAMGSQLSPVLVNIYMEYFEEMTSLKLSMWLRYVNDTFILWPHQEDVQTLLDYIYTVHYRKRTR